MESSVLDRVPSHSETDEGCKKQMERLLNIWKERSLYRADYIQQLKLAIEDNNSPIQRGSATYDDDDNVVAWLFTTELFSYTFLNITFCCLKRYRCISALCWLCRGEGPCEKKLSKDPGGWGGRRWWLQKPHIPSQYWVLCNSTGRMSQCHMTFESLTRSLLNGQKCSKTD